MDAIREAATTNCADGSAARCRHPAGREGVSTVQSDNVKGSCGRAGRRSMSSLAGIDRARAANSGTANAKIAQEDVNISAQNLQQVLATARDPAADVTMSPSRRHQGAGADRR
jgi:hypothetical protein